MTTSEKSGWRFREKCPATKNPWRGIAMSGEPGRKPDYILKALDKRTSNYTRVRSAWVNDEGHLSVILGPCVVLSGNNRNIVLSLFPNDYDPEIAKTRRGRKVAVNKE
jgi:hypothetical protein